MSIETLRRDYAQESDLLDAVYASARRGAQMVRQLLTFAKGMEGERHALQPAHLLKELRSIMGRTFPKSIDVDFRFDPTLPLILGDATQIHQVLLNLCVNARDAMPVGGHLVVEADACEIDPVYASSIADAHVGPYLRIRVRDTGTGMASDVMERIFEPFYSTKGPERGTGLGLSTALGIVRSHGGFMRVYSEPGEGSTFAVYLPIEADATEGIHDVALRSGFRGSQELVLIVDDERGVLAAGETVLRGLNLEPCVASDGVEALLHVTAHRERLRVAVVDLHMPHLDGVGFCRALRRLEPEMPIIIMSGRLEDAARDALEGLGVQAFLSKPFSEAELAHELEHALRSPQASEAAA